MAKQPAHERKATFALTLRAKNQLRQLLETAGCESSGEVTDHLERRTAKFHGAYKLVDGRSTVELWDRLLDSSEAHRGAYFDNEAGMTQRELARKYAKVAKADRLLVALCIDIGDLWMKATGKPLPIVKRNLRGSARASVGHKRLIRDNPLALLLDSLGINVCASSVNDLTRIAKRRSKIPEAH